MAPVIVLAHLVCCSRSDRPARTTSGAAPVAGATLGYVVPSFTADGAAGAVDFGLTGGGTDLSANGTQHYLSSFPYLGTPHSGFSNPATTPVSVAP